MARPLAQPDGALAVTPALAPVPRSKPAQKATSDKATRHLRHRGGVGGTEREASIPWLGVPTKHLYTAVRTANYAQVDFAADGT